MGQEILRLLFDEDSISQFKLSLSNQMGKSWYDENLQVIMAKRRQELQD
jgi:hypothetical protein